MLYFFHHYELPAILQQAQIQQLGRVHTVNIVLRNVPNNNNNNNQNLPNNPGNVGGGESTTGERGGPNPGPAAARPEGGARRVVPPMVNLVFRNMAAGVGNNRNGNASLSFVFRNVRNIVQSLQQNTNASTATNITSTTTTVTAQSSSTTSVTTTVSASQGSSTSDLSPSVSRIMQTSAPHAEVATVSSLSSNATPATQLSSSASQRSDAATSNSVNTNSSSTSSEFTSQAMFDLSSNSQRNSSSSSSSSFHNLNHSKSNDQLSQNHNQDTADYTAVPVQMTEHPSSSKDTERLKCLGSLESSDKSLPGHSDDCNNDLAPQVPDKSTREPHIETWSSVDDIKSYAVPRPPEEVSRQSTSSTAQLDDNNSA